MTLVLGTLTEVMRRRTVQGARAGHAHWKLNY